MQVGGTNSLRKLRRDWWKTRLCTSCVSPLGRLISRGGICPQCGLRVCKNCRSELEPGSGVWVCVLCSSGGMASDNLVKGSKSLGRDSRSIRRSWTISTSNPQRAQTNSPVLKSYTVLYPEESGPTLKPSSGSGNGNSCNSLSETPKSHRQFHSLPRMNSESDRSKKVKRSFNSEFEKENIKRHRSFQTTLHPYQVACPPSPSASINFIEDPFWDYYDYDIEESEFPRSPRRIWSPKNPRLRSSGSIMSRRNSIRNKLESEMDRLLNMRTTNSNRSSCERSLGETYDYDYSKSNYNSLSDTELNENTKFETIHEDKLTPRRFSTESSNFYRFATITPINMSPLNDPRKENPNIQRQNVQPVKPERRSTRNRRSISLNAYDGKKLFSPLRTYVVVMKENVVPKANSISDSENANINSTVESKNNGKNNGNTSSVLINSSSNLPPPPKASSEMNINNSTKFHSLPRERVIRIEREDWRFAKPSATSIHQDPTSSSSSGKKVSTVEITNSWDKGKNTTRVPIGGNKIARSQSYREISTTKPQSLLGHHDVPIAYNVKFEKSSPLGREIGRTTTTTTLPVIRTKAESSPPHQKPFFDSLLDDKDSITVMENFLRSHNQNRSHKASTLGGGGGGGGDCGSNNEKTHTVSPLSGTMIKEPSKKTDFVQSQMSDFENFQRQQIQTFDNYLRQCSTFPRALQKQGQKSMTRLEPEPKTTRHTTTTTITADDNATTSFDNFHHLVNRNEPKYSNNERIVPIFRVNGDEPISNSSPASWNATLPHPYIRRHKQQKSSFLLDQQNENDPSILEKFQSSRIHDIEREIERDIYFQKTKSLDRARPHKSSKPSILIEDRFRTTTEDTRSTEINDIPPVASPRLKRKAQLLQASNTSSSPKINTEQSYSHQEYVIGSGTNYPKNKVPSNSILNHQNTSSSSSSRLPNEPGPTGNTKEYDAITNITGANNLKSASTTNSVGNLNNISSGGIPVKGNLSKKDKLFSTHKDSFILESRARAQSQSTTNISKDKTSPTFIDGKMKGNININSDSSGFIGEEVNSSNSSELKLFSRPSLSSSLSPIQNTHSHSNEMQQQEKSPHHEQDINNQSNNNKNMENHHQSNKSPVPIATPRTRRKNNNHQHQLGLNYDEDHKHEVSTVSSNVNVHANSNNNIQDTIGGDTHLSGASGNGKSQLTNRVKAVRFEPHVMMEMENERRHNKARTNSGMRMNNNNFNNKQHLVTSPQSPDIPVSSLNTKDYPQYTRRNYSSGKSHYHHGGGVKSLKSSSDKTKRSHNQAYGFVARAIAKVKSKAKSNGSKSVGPITNININNTSAVRSVETRDSITYISPPPTQQKQQPTTVQEITPPTLSLNTNYFNQPISPAGIIRVESFKSSGGGQTKNESVESKKVSILHQDSSSNANTTKVKQTLVGRSSGLLKTNNSISPEKPKRSSLKMDHSKKSNNNNNCNNPTTPPPPDDSQNKDQDGHNKYLGLTIDQLTPSSSSSSSSSFMSNLQESYDFFHESEECESIEEDEDIIVEDESDEEGVFKSFEDDEDAGEDFIFYSNQLEEDEQRTSHAYHGPAANPNFNVNPTGSSSSKIVSSSGSIAIPNTHHDPDYHHLKKGDKNIKIRNKELRSKGLNKGQVDLAIEDNIINRKDGNHQQHQHFHHPQLHHEDGNNKKVEEGVDNNLDPLRIRTLKTNNAFSKEQVLTTSRLSDLMISETATHEEHVKQHKNEKEIQHQHHGLTTLYSKPVVVPQAKSSPHNKNTNKQWANQIEDPECSQEIAARAGGQQLLQSQSQKSQLQKSTTGVNTNKSQYGTKIQEETGAFKNSSDYLDLELSEGQRKDGYHPQPAEASGKLNPKFRLPKSNNLLLPSSFIKSATLPLKNYQFNQSEFFPGEFDEGMSMCKDLGSDTTFNNNNCTTTSTNQGRFKSRVLVNPSSEESAPSSPSSPLFTGLKGTFAPASSSGAGKKSKNVTTVDISGDVGIVTTNVNASSFLNNHRAQLKKVNESLWKNDVYASGLTQLNNQTPNVGKHLQQQQSDNDNNINHNTNCGSSQLDNVIDNDEEEDINPNGIIGSFDNEVGSSVSNNGSGGGSSDEKIGSSSGSEIGSDWHSESTKNTVIFRGEGDPKQQWTQSPSSVGGVFNYNCDPEIHISSITLVDTVVTGNGVTSESGSNSTTPENIIESTPIITTDTTTSNAKVEANQASGILNKSSDDKDTRDSRKNVKSLDNTNLNNSVIDSLVKGKSQSVSASSGLDVKESSKELNKPTTNEALTKLDDLHLQQSVEPLLQMPVVFEMVKSPEENIIKQSHQNVTSNKTSAFHQRRESPEGQEQEIPSTHSEKDAVVGKPSSNNNKTLSVNEVIIMEEKDPKESSSSQGVISKSKISQNVLSQITASSSSRSSPDGADADRSEGDSTTEPDVDSPTPMIEHFDVTSDEDSWVEEIIFEDDDTEPHMCRKLQPPPLDLTLHTIVEESCEESEAENSGNFNNIQSTSSHRRRGVTSSSQQKDNELEKYFNFGIYNDNGSQGGRNSLTNEESEFSDTFSESSFSLHDELELVSEGSLRSKGELSGTSIDPAELASSRLEKYFYNLGLPQSMINPISSINQTVDSDSVGSESESDNSVLENRKKVLKHHRRSADFEDEFGDKVSDEEEDFGFGQDGFDTIKKTARKAKKSGSESNLLDSSGGSSSKSSENLLLGIGGSGSPVPLEDSIVSQKDKKMPLAMSLSNGTSSSSKEESSSASPTSPSTSRKSGKTGDRPVIKVNRSNSFTWSSDEEVNIMMSKLRQLIRNLVKSKTESNANAESSGANSGSLSGTAGNLKKDKDKQLAYLENELIRLMKSENLKNIVEYFSSEESDVDDVYKFIKVVKESGSINSNHDDNSDFGDIDLEDPHLLKTLQTTMQVEDTPQISPKDSPALLAKVMHHIGNRLSVWMKDENLQEDDNNDDNVTLKCAQSVSSDLNEDRFSWKGSFESALAAKRQSVGSTDSISSSDFPQDRSILRSSSLHHLANSSHHLGQLEENKEEEETASSLPRMTNLCNSLPRLNQPSNLAISRAHSLVISGKTDGESTSSGPIKSARYRPPGFQPVKSKRMDEEGKHSPILSQSTPVLTQDPGNLKVRSDSMGSIFHDTKPHISVKGQVEFGLQYNYKLACLEVRVKQCRDLAAVDNKRNRSDPYVKAYLLPDRSKAGKRKTKTKKNTLNPLFEEILKFPLTLSDLQNRTLWLSVWNSDIFGKNEFLGEVLVDLKDRVFDDPNPQLWDLQEMSGQTEDMPRGDVVIALKWQPKTENTGNLAVLVKEAKNIAPVKNGSPSTFIKCMTLSDKSRKHKTSICRRSYNPVWNQTLNFEDIDDDGLEITLWNHDLLSNHDLLGTIRMDYDNPLWESMLSRHSFWVEGVLRLN